MLADLDLFRLLANVGRPVQTGSSVLGLMVGRDIDVTSLCPVLEPHPTFDAIRPLADHARVHRLNFRNDTGRWRTEPQYPDGLYWMVKYRSDAGDDWNLDLWFLLEGTTQFDLQHIESLPPRLTRGSRLAILRIKEAWHGLLAYGSRRYTAMTSTRPCWTMASRRPRNSSPTSTLDAGCHRCDLAAEPNLITTRLSLSAPR